LHRKIVAHVEREVRFSDAAAVAGESRVVTGLNRSGFVEIGGLVEGDGDQQRGQPEVTRLISCAPGLFGEAN
jgi:hypothetical protein